MADQSSTYSRIYDLRTKGVDKVIKDLSAIDGAFLSIAKNKRMLTGELGTFAQTLGKDLSQATAQMTKLQAATQQSLLDAKIATEQSKQAAAAKMAEARATTESIKQKEIEARLTASYAKELRRIQAERDREQAKLDKLNSAYARLNEEHKAAARSAQDLGAQYVFLEREIKRLESIGGGQIAPGMTSDLQAKKNQLAALAPTLKAAQENAFKLHTELLKIDQAVGRSQRNVGNYNSATAAMSQILREAPAFAYNFNTGLMAVSNNIPILIDEIEKLRKKNVELVAAGGKAIPVWKSLSAALTSPVGVITLLMAAFTILSARMQMSTNAMSTAEKAAKKYNDALKQIDESMTERIATEKANAAVWLSIAKDVTMSVAGRREAIDELRKAHESLFATYTDEQIMAGEAAAAENKLTEAIVLGAMQRANADKVAKAAVKVDELKAAKAIAETELQATQQLKNKLDNELNKVQYGKSDALINSSVDAQRRINGHKSDLVSINARIAKAEAELNGYAQKSIDLARQLNQIKNPAHSGRILADIDADIKNFERVRDTNAATTEAHKNAIAQLKVLAIERSKFIGEEHKERERGERDYLNATISAENKVTDFKAKQMRAQIEQEMEGQREVFDNLKASIVDRLAAYAAYATNQKRLLEIDNKAEIQGVQNKLAKIAEIEQAMADKKAGNSYNTSFFDRRGRLKPQEQTLMLNKPALEAELSYLQTEFANKVEQVQRTINNRLAGVIKSTIEQELKDIDRALADKAADLQAETAEKGSAIYSSDAANERKAKLIEDLRREQQLKADELQLAADKEKELLLQSQLNELKLRKTHNIAVIALELELQEQLTAIRQKRAADLAKVDGDKFAIDSEKAKQRDSIKQQAEQAALDTAQRFADSYISILEKQDAYRAAVAERQLAFNTRELNSIAQSNKEKETNARNAIIAEQQLEKEKALRRKRSAEAQAAINWALATTQIIVNTLQSPTAKAMPDGGFTQALIQEAAISGAFIAEIAKLNSVAAYAEGTEPGGHPGGLAVVGDGGESELLRVGSNFYVTPDKPTLLNMPAGAEVTPFSSMGGASYVGTMGAQLKAPMFSSRGADQGGSQQIKELTDTVGALSKMVGQTLAGLSNVTATIDGDSIGRYMRRSSYSDLRI